MKRITAVMMNLIAGEVFGKEVEYKELALSSAELKQLLELAKRHDLAHLVGNALIKNGLLEAEENKEIKSFFYKAFLASVYRYKQLDYELNRLTEALSEAKIKHIPLKGSVIRRLYPEPWMRTSCDIDLLVHESEVDSAAQLLVDKLGYSIMSKAYHDISMNSPSGVHLELHFSIKENDDRIDCLLSECWEHVQPSEGYTLSFTNEFFLFHQIAHASYHFLGGGCGVRAFLDLYLLRNHFDFDQGSLGEMLERTKLAVFARRMFHLSECWFGEGEYDDTARSLENYILFGGIYGNVENSVAVSQQKDKGRLGYILRSMWLPYDMLTINYPRLKGRRYLQPFYEVKRWFRIFIPSTRKRRLREMKAIKDLDTEKKQSVNRLLSELELL